MLQKLCSRRLLFISVCVWGFFNFWCTLFVLHGQWQAYPIILWPSKTTRLKAKNPGANLTIYWLRILFSSPFSSILFLVKSLSRSKLISFSWLILFQLQQNNLLWVTSSVAEWKCTCVVQVTFSGFKETFFLKCSAEWQGFQHLLKAEQQSNAFEAEEDRITSKISSFFPWGHLCSLWKHKSINYFLMQKTKGSSSQMSPSISQWVYCTQHMYQFLRLLLWNFPHSCLPDESWKSTKTGLCFQRGLHFTFPHRMNV